MNRYRARKLHMRKHQQLARGISCVRIVTIALLTFAASAFVPSPIRGDKKVEILRDEYGVPHIFATTEAAAAFGSGYAQAEDRLEELLRHYRRAEGTMAEAFG